MERIRITVEAVVNRPLEDVWEIWTNPLHVVEWNSASPDWHTPKAENDLRSGGMFNYLMAARDGSFQFEFFGTYDEVLPLKRIAYTMGDGRKVEVDFMEQEGSVRVTETFDAEETNPVEMQRAGWQSIMDHFKEYAEGARHA